MAKFTHSHTYWSFMSYYYVLFNDIPIINLMVWIVWETQCVTLPDNIF